MFFKELSFFFHLDWTEFMMHLSFYSLYNFSIVFCQLNMQYDDDNSCCYFCTIVVVTVGVWVGCLCHTITTTTTMNETLYNTEKRGLYSDCLYPETDPFLLPERLMKGLADSNY